MFLSLLVKLTSRGPIFYWSDRIGRHNTLFRMPKFRTMHTDAPAVATHLMNDPDRYLTPIGKFLRKSSFDEENLNQLIKNFCYSYHFKKRCFFSSRRYSEMAVNWALEE